MSVHPDAEAGLSGSVLLFADPGTEVVGEGFFGAVLNTEASSARLAGDDPEHVCTHITTDCNDGGYRVEGGIPVGEWVDVAIAIDYSAWPMSIYWGDLDAGFKRDIEFWGPDVENPVSPDPCVHTSHKLRIQLNTTGGTDADSAGVRIRDLAIGHTTCVVNPDYNPDAGDDDV